MISDAVPVFSCWHWYSLFKSYLSQVIVLSCDFPEEEIHVIPIIHGMQEVRF